MLAWTPVFKQDLLAEGIGCLVQLLRASTKAFSGGGFGTWYKNLQKMMGAILTRDENSRENPLTVPATVFFDRERKRERKNRTGKRNRYYGISGTESIGREHAD